MTRLLLVGNPNSGKTTLFNALTGDNQRVGNWPGVTVEQKTGLFILNKQRVEVTDLPGIYSLTAFSEHASQDEQLAAEAIVTLDVDLIVNVVDACYLERHLYLTSQVLELGKPVVVVLTMMDIAQQRGICIDCVALSSQLNCPVFPLQAHQCEEVEALKQKIVVLPEIVATPLALILPEAIKKQLIDVEQQLLVQGIPKSRVLYHAYRFAERDPSLDVSLADARYQAIHQVVSNVQQKKQDMREHFTAKLDRIVLHRVLALPLFFLAMYSMFFCAIKIGGVLQNYFDRATQILFVQGPAWILELWHAPDWLVTLIAYGVGKGINTTLTFIPVIAVMYFFLALLETSGYMARAAFVVDRLMRTLGLPGKAFVPMIVGFGCNVPAILAARTLSSEKERLLTILMSPFMSCSARLAIYTVFAAAFFPQNGQNVVFSLYLVGILIAILTGLFLRHTALQGKASPLILELPAYHCPGLGRLSKEMTLRLRYFVVRAAQLIIPVSVLLGGLNGLSLDEAHGQSLLSLIGQGLTPIFEPMGLHPDNWPATVGLLTGILAKEVVVGSLNSLYTQLGNLGATSVHFAWNTDMSPTTYGTMVQHFDGKIGAYAYLLFVLIYTPCVSTMAMIRQEANRKWMWFSIIWSLMMAYSISVSFYQLATFYRHPLQSTVWCLSLFIGLGLTCVFLRYRSLYRTIRGASYVTADP